jgi:hypothetical protein
MKKIEQHSLRHTVKFIALLVLVLCLLLPTAKVEADMVPKPSMEFNFEYQGEPLAIVKGELIECDDPECEIQIPLDSLSPMGYGVFFDCTR